MDKLWAEMTDRERDAMVAERVFGWGRVPDEYPDMGWHVEDGLRVLDVIPLYTSATMRRVEDEIERRDLWMAYTCALQGIVWSGEYAAYDYPDDVAWRLIRASAAQRCEAALRAMGAL